MRKMVMVALAATASFMTAQPALAAYTITFLEVGSDVTATGTGTLNITGLGYVGNFQDTAFISPGRNIALIGGANESVYNTSLRYSGVLGTGGGLEFANTGVGGLVGALGGSNQLAVPVGYVSGTLVAVSSVFANSTFASLGLNRGTVVVGFNSGVNADTLTFQIGAAVLPSAPEPASWAMMIAGFGAIGTAMRRRRTVVRFA